MSHGTEPQRRTGDTPEDLRCDINVLLDAEISDEARRAAVSLLEDLVSVSQRHMHTLLDTGIAEAIRARLEHIAEMTPTYLQDDILRRQQERSLINEEV